MKSAQQFDAGKSLAAGNSECGHGAVATFGATTPASTPLAHAARVEPSLLIRAYTRSLRGYGEIGPFSFELKGGRR